MIKNILSSLYLKEPQSFDIPTQCGTLLHYPLHWIFMVLCFYGFLLFHCELETMQSFLLCFYNIYDKNKIIVQFSNWNNKHNFYLYNKIDIFNKGLLMLHTHIILQNIMKRFYCPDVFYNLLV